MKEKTIDKDFGIPLSLKQRMLKKALDLYMSKLGKPVSKMTPEELSSYRDAFLDKCIEYKIY